MAVARPIQAGGGLSEACPWLGASGNGTRIRLMSGLYVAAMSRCATSGYRLVEARRLEVNTSPSDRRRESNCLRAPRGCLRSWGVNRQPLVPSVDRGVGGPQESDSVTRRLYFASS